MLQITLQIIWQLRKIKIKKKNGPILQEPQTTKTLSKLNQKPEHSITIKGIKFVIKNLLSPPSPKSF